jgi:hypothetical protein
LIKTSAGEFGIWNTWQIKIIELNGGTLGYWMENEQMSKSQRKQCGETNAYSLDFESH